MRLKTLDLLRLMAVALVLGRHMTPCPASQSPTLSAVSMAWFRGGWVGVDLFFVLSGFLIAGLLFGELNRNGRIHFTRFFVRRGLKIYPPFLALVAVTIVVRAAIGEGIDWWGLLREVTFLQNYGGGLWNHTWSLAVEEHFYLLLPLVLAVGLWLAPSSKISIAWLPPVFVLVAAVCLGWRVSMLWTTRHYNHMTHLFPTHLRIDSLLCGVLLAYLFHFHSSEFRAMSDRYRVPSLIAAGLLFLPAFVLTLEDSAFIYTVGLSLFWCASALLIFSLAHVNCPDTPLLNGLAFVGSQSYSIYLWHMAVATWGASLIGLDAKSNWGMHAVFYLCGSLLIGILMGRLVEAPVLRFRDRLFPSRTSPIAEQPPLLPIPIVLSSSEMAG